MDCTKCSLKNCRRLSPCVDNSEKYIEEYYSLQNSKLLSCSLDGISESRINKAKEKQVVSCNPIGQAYVPK